MNDVTAEWVARAEGDFASLNREPRARTSLNHGDACFHAQQCAEKYLKACLHRANIYFEKTHNLATLLDRILSLEPLWEVLRKGLQVLTLHAVEVRYPGVSATRAMAVDAAQVCRRVRGLARAHLGLPIRVERRRRTGGKSRPKGIRTRKRKK